MGVIDLDLSEFENPRPTRISTSAEPPKAPSSDGEEFSREHAPPSRSKKRKLPYRADVVVEGRRYKGKRVSRGEADLDVEAIGLLDDSRSHENEPVEDASSGEELEDDLSHLPDGDHSDMEVEDKEEDAAQVVSSRAERLEAEERAVAARIVEIEKKELIRARAVRKQKEVYDAVVDLRIRVEPLISLARQFPGVADRETCASWSHTEELEDVLKEAESSLSGLLKQSSKAWSASWPSDDDEASDAGFERWRDAVLDRWGTKVNEASGVIPKGGFKTIDTTVSAQLKAALASGKHLTRTRRVKEPIALLGDNLELPQGSSLIQFEDGDFYRTLLREIIESGEGAGGGLRYAQLSKGGKVKKKRDRSFAKGRRLRYDVHEKLVGFLAPVPLPDPGPLDEIVAAMFGKHGTVPTTT